MPDIQNIYPFNPTGLLPNAVITGELHTITPPSASTPAGFIVPRASPFFKAGLVIRMNNPTTGTILSEGIDYYLTHHFIEASNKTGLPIYGGIAFTSRTFSGNIYLTYSTLGGEWVLDDSSLIENLTRQLYNVRTVTWDQVVGLPAVFPTIDHTHTAVDLTGMAEVVNAINALSQSVAAGTTTQSAAFIAAVNAYQQTLNTKLGVGSYGVGATTAQTRRMDAVDLHSIKTLNKSGVWWYDGGAGWQSLNAPTQIGTYEYTHIETNTAGHEYGHARFWDLGNGRLYTNTLDNGTWEGWNRVLYKDDYGIGSDLAQLTSRHIRNQSFNNVNWGNYLGRAFVSCDGLTPNPGAHMWPFTWAILDVTTEGNGLVYIKAMDSSGSLHTRRRYADGNWSPWRTAAMLNDSVRFNGVLSDSTITAPAFAVGPVNDAAQGIYLAEENNNLVFRRRANSDLMGYIATNTGGNIPRSQNDLAFATTKWAKETLLEAGEFGIGVNLNTRAIINTDFHALTWNDAMLGDWYIAIPAGHPDWYHLPDEFQNGWLNVKRVDSTFMLSLYSLQTRIIHTAAFVNGQGITWDVRASTIGEVNAVTNYATALGQSVRNDTSWNLSRVTPLVVLIVSVYFINNQLYVNTDSHSTRPMSNGVMPSGLVTVNIGPVDANSNVTVTHENNNQYLHVAFGNDYGGDGWNNRYVTADVITTLDSIYLAPVVKHAFGNDWRIFIKDDGSPNGIVGQPGGTKWLIQLWA